MPETAAKQELQQNRMANIEGRLTRKWKCSLCNLILESEYIFNYHRLLEHSESRRPPVGVA
jgi:hypothetical protein